MALLIICALCFAVARPNTPRTIFWIFVAARSFLRLICRHPQSEGTYPPPQPTATALTRAARFLAFASRARFAARTRLKWRLPINPRTTLCTLRTALSASSHRRNLVYVCHFCHAELVKPCRMRPITFTAVPAAHSSLYFFSPSENNNSGGIIPRVAASNSFNCAPQNLVSNQRATLSTLMRTSFVCVFTRDRDTPNVPESRSALIADAS